MFFIFARNFFFYICEKVFFIKECPKAQTLKRAERKVSQRVDYKTSREKSVPKPSMGKDGDKDVLWVKIIKNKYTWEWRFFFEWGGGWAGGGLGVGWGWAGGGGERCSKAQVIFVKKKNLV